MKRITLVITAITCALVAVACTSSAPPQQDGLKKYEQTMSLADAQKLTAEVNEAGHHCTVPDCSYSSPDANGMVVFEAAINCACTDCCSILKAETGCN